jgi:hypothetical protein
MRKFAIALIAAAVALPAAPAFADPPSWAPAHGKRAKQAQRYDRDDRYYEPARIARQDQIWQGDDGRYHCRRPNGTTGLVIGGAAGALLGREIDGGRDRTLGTVLGAAGGALLGREVERGRASCR